MTRQDFPGGWYVDALPTGERCVLLKAHKTIETHVGKLPLPLGESFGVLFLALTNVGSFRFAGQAHDTTNPAAHEWIDGFGWRALPPPCCGTNPVIYDVHGVLLRSDCSIGSQGWRYVDDAGKPVTGDNTLRFTLPSGGLIHEFTEIDGLIIGQGHEDGVRVWDGAHERRLHPGACFNIRVHRLGQQATVSFYEVAPDGLSAHIYDLTLAELRALPIVGVAAPAPIPVPQPKPEPVPVSNPTIPDAEIARAKAEIAAHPLGENLPDLPWTRARVQALGGRWGLNGKRGDPANLSHDIFAWRVDNAQPILVDVLGDGGGANVEAFQILPYPEPAGAVWVDPGVPDSGTNAPIPVTPPAPMVDLSAVLAKLDALNTLLMDLRAAVETTALDVDFIQAHLSQPASVKFPNYSGTAKLGTTMRFTLEPQK